jgi:hypothetical protein
MTYLCYIDESGTPEVPGTSSHFVLVGLALPIAEWARADQAITTVLSKYGLADAEVHTAWMLRRLNEQDKIPGFEKLSRAARASACERYRAGELLRLQRINNKAYKQAKKNYQHTKDYTHLTLAERKSVVSDIAELIASWDFAYLFAESINKIHFDQARTKRTISEQSFEQPGDAL